MNVEDLYCGVPDTWTDRCPYFADECPYPSHVEARAGKQKLATPEPNTENERVSQRDIDEIAKVVMDHIRTGDPNPLQVQRMMRALESLKEYGGDPLEELTSPYGIRVNLFTRISNGLLPHTLEEWELAREELDPLSLAELATRKPIHVDAVPDDLKPYRGMPYLTYTALASAKDPDWQPPELDESLFPPPWEQDPIDPFRGGSTHWEKMQWHLRRARDYGWTGEWLHEDPKFGDLG